MARTRTYHPGIIELGKKVIISDPSYEPGIWCCREAEILPGKYECSVRRNKLKTWGDRSVSVRIQHMDYPDVKCNIDLLYIGVDSGQAGFFDAEYYQEKAGDAEPYKGVNEEWYKRICAITINDKKPFGTIDAKGVVTESGLGDGCYFCFAGKNTKGEIVALEIVFLDDYEIKEINEEA